MNVLFLLRLWPVYGGGETVTIRLANGMIKKGWQVSVAYFKESVKKDALCVDSRVSLFRIDGVDCNEFEADASCGQYVQDNVIRVIKDKNIDVVINQWWPVYYIDRLKSETKAKIITCLHQAFYTPSFSGSGISSVAKKLFSPLYKAYKKAKAVKAVRDYLPFVDKYIFLSPSFQRQFMDFANYTDNEDKLGAIPNPLVYDANTTEDELESKENIVLLVGRMLEGQKRITRAIRIWKMIEADKELNGWRFVVVGEGPDLPLYKKMAHKFRLQRISFEGYQNPLPYYKRAKIFMMTSAFEGFPMTLVEAQQCGVVPVVMDSYLSLHDIVEDGVNGMITPNGDVPMFARKLSSLMKNDAFRLGMAVNALETSKKFNVDNILKKWEVYIR